MVVKITSAYQSVYVSDAWSWSIEDFRYVEGT